MTIIGIAGDWHCNEKWASAALEAFSAIGVTTIAHLGDFGVWQGQRGREYLITISALLTEYKQTLYVTLGNHEDYDIVENDFLTVTDGDNAGWQFLEEFPKILFATRGQRWTWHNRTFVSLGGGNSIDRYMRSPGSSWWAGEQITNADVQRTVAGGFADVMLAHDAPAGLDLFGGGRDTDLGGGWSRRDVAYASESRAAMRIAVDSVMPELFFHGHYHRYLDLTTQLVDGHGEGYTLHSIGLDMDDTVANLGVLNLETLRFELLA